MNAVANQSVESPRERLFSGYSLEITAKDAEELPAIASRFAPGARTSVTYLPNETLEKRLKAVRSVLSSGLTPVPHIAARRIESEAVLDEYLGALAAINGCEHVFIIAGDPEAAMGPYDVSLDVIESGLLERHGVKSVGIGGHPEGHPAAPMDVMWKALEDKTAAARRRGLDVAILTQFGFDEVPVLAWLAELRQRGIDAPVRLGIPGPANAAKLLRFAARCGVAASTSVLSKYGLSLTKLMSTAGPERYVTALANGIDPAVHGTVGLHFYPFGGLKTTADWIEDYQAGKYR